MSLPISFPPTETSKKTIGLSLFETFIPPDILDKKKRCIISCEGERLWTMKKRCFAVKILLWLSICFSFLSVEFVNCNSQLWFGQFWQDRLISGLISPSSFQNSAFSKWLILIDLLIVGLKHLSLLLFRALPILQETQNENLKHQRALNTIVKNWLMEVPSWDLF